MTTPMSPEHLAEYRVLLAAEHLTPGPWLADDHEIYQDEFGTTVHGPWVGETCNVELPDRGRANAMFITAARTAVPALLAEVERLTAEVAVARAAGYRNAANNAAEIVADRGADADAEMLLVFLSRGAELREHFAAGLAGRPVEEQQRAALRTALYDAVRTFNATACWPILQLAQMRGYLADHLTDALTRGGQPTAATPTTEETS